MIKEKDPCRFYVYYLWLEPDNEDEKRIVYVGKGSGTRASNQLRTLAKGNHYNKKLQRLFNEKTGVFTYEIAFRGLEEDAAYALEEEEVFRIGLSNLANGTIGGIGGKGAVRSEDFKRNLSIKNTGRTWGEDVRARMSKAQMGNQKGKGNKGKKRTPEQIAVMVELSKGNTYALGYKQSAQTCANVSASLIGNTRHKGKKHSAETRALLSKRSTGRKYAPRSEESRARTSAALLAANERRRNEGLSIKRKPCSDETKAKIGAANKLRAAERIANGLVVGSGVRNADGTFGKVAQEQHALKQAAD